MLKFFTSRQGSAIPITPKRCRWRGAWSCHRAWAVEANGGRIELESDEEKESLFRVVYLSPRRILLSRELFDQML
jgi:hypothetical protein